MEYNGLNGPGKSLRKKSKWRLMASGKALCVQRSERDIAADLPEKRKSRRRDRQRERATAAGETRDPHGGKIKNGELER